MVKEETERRYFRKLAREIENATPSVKRKIRQNARQKGKQAYVAALERSIRTTEAEKQVLLQLLHIYGNDHKRLMDKLRPYGIVI